LLYFCLVAGNPITAFLTIIRHASLALPFFGIMLLQVHRLKVLLPAFFATQVLNDRDQSGTNQEIFCCCCYCYFGSLSIQILDFTIL
jgi:hypothetical protein